MAQISYIKYFQILILLLNTALLLMALFYFFNGSFETFPTEERTESVKIVMGGLAFIFLILEIFLVRRFFGGKKAKFN